MELRSRADVPAKDTWNLELMYAAPADWERHYVELEALLPGLSRHQGRLGESSQIVLEAIESHLGFQRQLERLYCYAHQRSDEDTGNSGNLGMYDRARNLNMRSSTELSYFTPELLSLPQETLDRYLASAELAPYKRLLKEIIRFKPHTLSEKEEELLARAGEVLGSCDRVFTLLNNADLQFGTVTVRGQEMPISHGSYTVILKEPDREVRKEAFTKFSAEYEAHKNTLSATLGGAIKRDVFLAAAKNYPSALDRALFSENIPRGVYENLVGTMNANLEPLHRYYAVRKKILKLDQLHPWDTAVPLVADIDTNYPYATACETILESLQPLGSDYTTALRKGFFEERWVDIYENKGKRSGAYSGGCYDSAPYMLMNYKDNDLDSMYTLTHEAGHSMHSYYAQRSQPYHEFGYSIFVAEVASTFNEQLLTHHLRTAKGNDKRFLAYLINQQLDDIAATFYRQTMFAEFEMETHALAEANQALTVESIQEVFSKILRKYNGPALETHDLSWITAIRIPHFYYGFYVYKYATGLSAAIALAERVLKGGGAEREDYLNFLRAGGSKDPIDVLRDAGVDMTSPAPIEAAARLFGQLVDELERLLVS